MWSQLAWSVLVFGFGILAAYMDIDSFFRKSRVGYTLQSNVRFWAFVLLNGALSAAILLWALWGDSNSLINKVIQVESPLAKMFVIGFGVPLIIRSKLFSFGEGQTAVGPALAYDWVRLKTLFSINMKSAAKKGQIAAQYAKSLAGGAGLPTTIKDWVDEYVRPFVSPSDQTQLDKEFDLIQARYTGAGAAGEDHLRTLIRWAMDNTSISYIEDRLK